MKKASLIPVLSALCILVSVWVVTQQYYRGADLKKQLIAAKAELKQAVADYNVSKKPGSPPLSHHDDD